MLKKQTEYFVGTSGYHYDHWEGLFYPAGLSKSKWLEFYARRFPTVELNNTFSHLPSEQAFHSWHQATPRSFLFALKVSRLITHFRKLRNVEQAQLLGDKLGPLLYQLPPQMHRQEEVLEDFLSLLPAGLKHAFEFRHQSWIDEGVFQVLRRHNAVLCVYDMPGFSCPLVATADFAYIRFHGSTGLYSSCYSDEEMEAWAQKIKGLPGSVKSVFIYFNNDAEAYAVKNALPWQRSLRADLLNSS